MATTEADFALGDKATSYWDVEYDKLVAALQGLVALFNAKTSTGTEPNDHLQGIKLGDASAHNDVRLYYDGTNIVFQKNTGSEVSPVWSAIITIFPASAQITCGAISAAGNLSMNSNNITNVGTVDGVDVSAHATRHEPGGADPFTFATPSDIAAANAAGSATSFVRGDHAHRGVRSFNTAFGDVTVSGSTGITVSGTSSTTIAANLRVYAYTDTSSPGTLTCTGSSLTAFTQYADIALPAADGSTEYLVEFMCKVWQNGATGDTTIFSMHFGTNGSVADATVYQRTITTTTSGETYDVSLAAVVQNPTASSRITISYDSTTGSIHQMLGSSTAGVPILRMTRLTSHTAV